MELKSSKKRAIISMYSARGSRLELYRDLDLASQLMPLLRGLLCFLRFLFQKTRLKPIKTFPIAWRSTMRGLFWRGRLDSKKIKFLSESLGRRPFMAISSLKKTRTLQTTEILFN